jgi:hypothetical protein
LLVVNDNFALHLNELLAEASVTRASTKVSGGIYITTLRIHVIPQTDSL